MKTASRSIASPFRPKQKKARSYRRDVLYTLVRHTLSDFDAIQGQWVLPNTDKVYKKVSRSKKWKKNTIELEHGAKGHWLGHSDAKYVLLYFHGGGYVAPSTPGHLKYQFHLQKYLRKQGLDVSIFSLSYVLAPKVLHPAFIQQSTSALKHLIEKDGRDPSTIIIAGDSAGGNMAASLLLHLGKPHPGCEAYKLKSKLRGALLISPWVSFDTGAASITKNKHSDYLTKSALEYGKITFIPKDSEHDPYSQPVDAPVDWWKAVAEKVVDKALVWGGGGEVLIDGIRQFAHNLMSGFEDAVDVQEEKNELLKMMTVDVEKLHPEVHLRAKLIVSPFEAHEEMIINRLFYINKDGDGGRQIKQWLVDTFKDEHNILAPVKTNQGLPAEEPKPAIETKAIDDAKLEKVVKEDEASEPKADEKPVVAESKPEVVDGTTPAPAPTFQGVADTDETIDEAKSNQEIVDATKDSAK